MDTLVLDQSNLDGLAIDAVDGLTSPTLGFQFEVVAAFAITTEKETDTLPALVMVPTEVGLIEAYEMSHFVSDGIIDTLEGRVEKLDVDFQFHGTMGIAANGSDVTDDEVDGSIESEETSGLVFDFFEDGIGFLSGDAHDVLRVD